MNDKNYLQNKEKFIKRLKIFLNSNKEYAKEKKLDNEELKLLYKLNFVKDELFMISNNLNKYIENFSQRTMDIILDNSEQVYKINKIFESYENQKTITLFSSQKKEETINETKLDFSFLGNGLLSKEKKKKQKNATK